MYPETDEYQWDWGSKTQRLRYERMRVDSDLAYNRALMTIGAVLLNHLASGIDAMRVARKVRTEPSKTQMGTACLPQGGFLIFLVQRF